MMLATSKRRIAFILIFILKCLNKQLIILYLERVMAVGKKFHSIARSLIDHFNIESQYGMVAYLIQGDSVGGRGGSGVRHKGWGIGEAKRLGEESGNWTVSLDRSLACLIGCSH